MTTETHSQLPIPEAPAWARWIAKEEFTQAENTVVKSQALSWSRPTRYGTPKCKVNGKIVIHLEALPVKKGSSEMVFTMSLVGHASLHTADLSVCEISEDTLVSKGRQIEMKLVDAWRELSY